MRRSCAGFLLMAAIAGAFAPRRSPAADQTWLRAATPNFELYTTDSERRAREAIIHFEQVRAFFASTASNLTLPAYPVRIVGFRSEKEFSPYRPFVGVAGYYQSGLHHDTVVMQGLDRTMFPTAVHEYVHLVLRHGNVKSSIWLQEGLAELYSTMTPSGRDSIRVGDIPAGRRAVLFNSRWLDLAVLMGADQAWLSSGGRDRINIFYAQSWALTHMMALSDAYRPTFPALFELLAGGAEPAAAIQKIYGKSLAQVAADLDSYIRSYLFKAALFRSAPPKLAEQPELRPATAIEQSMVLADLDASRPDRRELARKAYATLAAGSPASWEPCAGLAYLALAAGDREEAGRQFARAEELGIPDYRLYLHWGTYAPPYREPAEVVRIFRKALELRPDDPETLYRAGLAFYQARDCKAALEQLRRLTRVTQEQAPNFLRAVALCSYDLGQEEESRKAASRLLTIARTEEERESAQKLLDTVTRPRGQLVERRVVPAPQMREREPEPPSAAPPDEAPPEVQPPPPPPDTKPAEGLLVQVDCQGEGARIWLQTAGRKLAFLIRAGRSISVLRGGQDVLGSLQCGPQPKPERVTVRYLENPEGAGSPGIVRVLEFH